MGSTDSRQDKAEEPLNGDGTPLSLDSDAAPTTLSAGNAETPLQDVGIECEANLSAVLPVKPPPGVPPVVDVVDLDWMAVRDRVDKAGVRSRMPGIVRRMEKLLEQTAELEILFDADRSFPRDRAIKVSKIDEGALWFIGDLHGDLLALEAALLLIRSHIQHGSLDSRILFLGDFFDDEGFGLEVLLRVFEVVLENPALVCIVIGNHDEALEFDGARFTSSVSPSDFAEFLNNNADDEWVTRTGKLAIEVFAKSPRALFFPDGLLVAHGGFPLTDLHPRLLETGDWNDPACLSDFVWTRAHPTARKKLPNRYSRGSQFGFEDFAAFCSVADQLGRPVTHMVRGHDHVEQRFAVYPAYRSNPILTTVALSRRLSREFLGPYARAPTVARYAPGELPQVFRLELPPALIEEVYPELKEGADTQLGSPTGVP